MLSVGGALRCVTKDPNGILDTSFNVDFCRTIDEMTQNKSNYNETTIKVVLNSLVISRIFCKVGHLGPSSIVTEIYNRSQISESRYDIHM